MKCTIVRARDWAYTYLYLPVDFDADELPAELVQRFDFEDEVMTLELSPDFPLAQVDVKTVMRQLRDPGYFVQLPPDEDPSGWLDLPAK